MNLLSSAARTDGTSCDNMSNNSSTIAPPAISAAAIAAVSNFTAALVLFGIACSVDVRTLRSSASRHLNLMVVGLLSQWIFMPAMASAWSGIFDMPVHLAFALIVIGCAPGGTSSNTLAYLAAGDTALSILLTSTTNILALGTLPLFLALWTSYANLSVSIPYEQILLSLLVVIVPATCGVLLRSRRPHAARIWERFGAALGIAVTVLAILVVVIMNRDTLALEETRPTPGAWAAVALAAPSGMLFALLVLLGIHGIRERWCPCGGQSTSAQINQRPIGIPVIVTVVLETGIQNVPLALAVMNVTLAAGDFTTEQIIGSQLLAGMWTVITTVEGVVVMLLSRWAQGLPLLHPARGEQEMVDHKRAESADTP
jgi:predicted Na+-dependent transporter